MKKLILIIIILLVTISIFGQGEVLKRDLTIQKAAPILFLNGTGAIIDFYNNDIRLTQSSNTLTMSGGTFAISGGYSFLLTGDIGTTGSRAGKGWFTNIESTNMPTVGGSSLSTIFISSVEGEIYQLKGIIGTTGSFPSNGDSLIVNVGFISNTYLKVYRDGSLQWFNNGLTNNTGNLEDVYVFNSGTGTIIVRPKFITGEKIIIEAYNSSIWTTLTP
jgi:hypothetical protein